MDRIPGGGIFTRRRGDTEGEGLTAKYTKHTKRKCAGKDFTTEDTENTEKNREEGLEEIARCYLLQPVGGFSLWVGRDDGARLKMSKDSSTLRG